MQLHARAGRESYSTDDGHVDSQAENADAQSVARGSLIARAELASMSLEATHVAHFGPLPADRFVPHSVPALCHYVPLCHSPFLHSEAAELVGMRVVPHLRNNH